MHEVGLMDSALAMVAEAAAREGADRVTAVRVRVGPLSGVVPDALQFAFDALCPGTVAEGARLVIERAPLVCYCLPCASEYEAQEVGDLCPACGGAEIEVRGGTEFELASLEVT